MISFRYHIVSIVAVFLALALGIVIGASGLRGAVLDDLHKQVKTLKAENSSLRGTNDKLKQQSDDADSFASTYAAKVLAGTLTDQSVAIIAAPGVKPDGETVRGVAEAIAAAGGTVTATIGLTGDYADPSAAQALTKFVTGDVHPEGLQYPETDDAATLAASLLAYVLSTQGKAEELTAVVSGMADSHWLTTTKVDPQPGAKLAVLVTAGTPGAKSGVVSSMLALVTQFAGAALGTVIAGDTVSAQPGGTLAAVRDSEIDKVVSTVDNADTALGRVSCALALAEILTGSTGQYGTGPGAEDLFPSPLK
jgi:hypothetical protein